MRPRRPLALVAVVLFAAQSGCTLIYGDREPGGIGGNGAGGSGGTGGAGGSGGTGGTGGGRCAPTNAADVGAVCGTITDGCGGMLACGDCASGQTCGGAGANRCGTGACVPQTCQQLGVACGQFSDGCAGVLDCGACACTPTTCAAQQASCGTVDDGCGHTLDCGACPPGSWNAIIPPSSGAFVGVAYGSSGLWIADQGGNVLHSTDDTHFAQLKVQGFLTTLYVDGSDVWVGGSDGISYKGGSATSFTMLPGSPGYVQSIHGVPGNLYAVTDGVTSGVYHSNDGINWSNVSPTPAPTHLRAVFASWADVFAVGSGGMIYHSTDDGTSWSNRSVGDVNDLHAVWGSGSLVIVAAQGRFFRSTDGGANWTASVYGSATYFGLAGTGATDIWAVGSATTVLHSTNGGASWTQAPDVSGGGVAFYSVFAGATKQYAVGDSGAIIMRTN